MSESNSASNDPFLESLIYFTEHYQLTKSREALCAGLPLVNGKLTPSLFVRAALRAGLSAKIIQRDLSEISSLLLPTLLQLNDNQVCILLKKDADTGQTEIYFPLTQEKRQIHLSNLSKLYSGFAILIQPNTKEEMLHSPKDKPSTNWFWETLWRYRQYYKQVLIAAFLINLFTLATPLFTLNVYDRVIPNNATVTLWVLFSGIMIIFLFDFLLRTLRAYLMDFSGKKAVVSMESILLEHVLSMRLEYKPKSVGAYVGQFREFEFLKDFFSSATLTTIIDFPFMVLFLIAIAYIGGMIVFVPLFILPILSLAIYLAHNPTRKYVKQWSEILARRNGLLVESLTGLETIKSTRAEGAIQGEWEQLVSTGSQIGIHSRLISGGLSNIMLFVQQLMTILMVVVGVYLINANSLTMGGLIACTILGGRILAPFNQIINMLMRYEQAKDALTGLSKVMVTPNERPTHRHFLIFNPPQKNIRFENVRFSYHKENHSALDDISLNISIGERIGLIGRTGSGKSTLLKLLAGFYHPTEGQIFIDNVDMTQFDPGDYRKTINYLPQDSVLFSGSIRKNILFGKPNAKDDEMIQAAHIAGVEAFVQKHPLGYDMPIGERGEGLSGGQRQAVAIARMLMLNPQILLWDEPTSAMDETTEKELIQKIMNFIAGKTLIVATHKMSLLTLVDRLIVIHAGKIVMDGPRDQILAKIAPPPPSTPRWS